MSSPPTGSIVPAEARASTGGRKAQTWQFNARHRTAIGVALRPTEVVCMAVDLRGNVIAEHKVTMARRNDNAYYERAAHTISTFAQSLPSPIGVCFALRRARAPLHLRGRGLECGHRVVPRHQSHSHIALLTHCAQRRLRHRRTA